MNQQTKTVNESCESFQQWCFKETVELERKRKELEREQRALKEEKQSFEWEKKDFYIRQETEDMKLVQREKLLDMKWEILEKELHKLAGDRAIVEEQKNYYEEQIRSGFAGGDEETPMANPGMFFSGVSNELALKKRYKDLIKIYHPDNLCGDTRTLQEINKEYERLKEAYV